MKRIIAVLYVVVLVAVLVAGCSTTSAIISGDTSAASLKAAACSDAKGGYMLAEMMLSDSATSVDSDASKYWNAYKAGADAVIKLNCGGDTVVAK